MKKLFIILALCAIIAPLCAMEKDQKPQLSQLEKKFIRAAIDGDVEIIQHCIDEKVAINTADEHGETALYNAVYHQHWQAASLLLNQPKIYVDIKTKTGFMGPTLLHRLCLRISKNNDADTKEAESARLAILKRVLELKADTNMPDGYGDTPLINAMRQQVPVDIIDCLIDANAKMIWTKDKVSPLTLGVTKNIYYIPSLLASPHIALADIKQALVYSARYKYECPKFIKKYFDVMATFGYVDPKNPEWRASQRGPFGKIPLPIAKKIAYEIVAYDAAWALTPCSIL